MTTTLPQATDTTRVDYALGLAELGNFLLAHPDMPLPTKTVSYCVLAPTDTEGRAEVDRIAALLGEPAYHHADESRVTRKFDGVTYDAFYITRDRSRQWREDMHTRDRIRAGELAVIPAVIPAVEAVA